MYQTSQYFKDLIMQPSRSVKAKVNIRGIDYFDDTVISMSSEETVNPGEDFTLGSTASSKLELTINSITGVVLENATIKPYIGIDINGVTEYVPLGVFTTDEVKALNKTIQLTCFDNMIKFEKAYFSNLTYPATIQAVAAEICQKAGVSFISTLPNYNIAALEGYTLREAIGFIASSVGGFTRFNRIGQLEILFYSDTDISITPDNYFNLETAEHVFTIGKVTAQVNGSVLSLGNGNEVVFENPFITQNMLQSIYNNLNGLSYMPYNMKWQGNPAIQAGDKIHITDLKGNQYYTLITQQKLSYKGGLTAETKAVGKSDTGNQFSSLGSMTQKLERYTIEQANIKVLLAEKASINDLYVIDARIDNLVVNTAQIADASITNVKIVDATITGAKIANLAVGTANIQLASITNALIGIAAVSTANIIDGSITNAKIYDATITGAKILDATITSAKIANATIEGANIKSATIDTANIKAGAITTALIGTGAIQTAQIADASITSAKIVELTANLITAGTLSVERLIIRGSNSSLVYALNNITGALQAQKVDTLNGEILTPRTITVDKIVAHSITANEIASKTITANEIAVNTITAASGIIANAAITTAMIADASITSAKIGSIDAGKITTGMLSGDFIKGGTITGALLKTSNTNNYIQLHDQYMDFYINSGGIASKIMDIGYNTYTDTNGVVHNTPLLRFTTVSNYGIPALRYEESQVIAYINRFDGNVQFTNDVQVNGGFTLNTPSMLGKVRIDSYGAGRLTSNGMELVKGICPYDVENNKRASVLCEKVYANSESYFGILNTLSDPWAGVACAIKAYGNIAASGTIRSNSLVATYGIRVEVADGYITTYDPNTNNQLSMHCNNGAAWLHYFVNGNVVSGWQFNADSNIVTGNPVTADRFYCNNWFRSTGSSGWYNETYGGGIMMQDATWIRTWNSRSFYCDQVIRADGGFQSGGSASKITIGADGSFAFNLGNGNKFQFDAAAMALYTYISGVWHRIAG